VRQTHGLLIDIVLTAEDFIVLSSPYLRNLNSVNPALNGALIEALKRGVKLHILSAEKSLDFANLLQYKDYKVFIYKPNENNAE
jgi:hypothetical protein